MAKPICHVMVDLETLAIGPKAAPIQAGLCYQNTAGVMVTYTAAVSPARYREAGVDFKIDQGTIDWHKKTNPANYESTLGSTLTPAQLAHGINNFIREAKQDASHSIWLWSCGTDFDIPILYNLFAYAGIKPCWSYSYVRDYRTVRELFPHIPARKSNDHNALNDTINQFHHLNEIFQATQQGVTPSGDRTYIPRS